MCILISRTNLQLSFLLRTKVVQECLPCQTENTNPTAFSIKPKIQSWSVNVIDSQVSKSMVISNISAIRLTFLIQLKWLLTLQVPTPQNDQTHSNNLSANCQLIVWMCLTILWGWRLKSHGKPRISYHKGTNFRDFREFWSISWN